MQIVPLFDSPYLKLYLKKKASVVMYPQKKNHFQFDFYRKSPDDLYVSSSFIGIGFSSVFTYQMNDL